ncbi:MAG: hypothetical protein JNL01_09870 [Bdellovibrionales bacterium]|nr:hypothetical protein [Bdellovibrionales bacterium]
MVSSSPTFQKPGIKAPGQKVLVAFSGKLTRGDSLLVAALLKSQGYWVTAYHLRYGKWADSPEPDFPKMECLSEIPQDAVKKLCDALEIPLIVDNVQDEFSEKVLDRMIHEAMGSRQARPCVWCHQEIRLPRLLKKADELGIEKVATGHHAQISSDITGKSHRLKRSVNRNLDQTSELFQLSQVQLSRLILPLGAIAQPMLARLSQELNLGKVTGNRGEKDASAYQVTPECMTGDSRFFKYVEGKTAPSLRNPGVIRGIDGSVLGEHFGTYQFRVGDPLPGVILVQGQAFVIGIDHALNAVLAGPIEALKTSEILVQDVRWVVPVGGLGSQPCLVYSPPTGADKVPMVPQPAEFVTFENGAARVFLKTPSPDFTPGRPILFYDGDEVLGGGLVDRIHGF